MHTAPAKIILFGEHAVVYGQPAIAVPFRALHAAAQATPTTSGSGLTLIARDLDMRLKYAPSNAHDNALLYAVQLTLQVLNVPPPDLDIEITATIPIASGLGSGAAISAALIRELSAALGSPIEGDRLNDMVYEVEKLHHSTPSGIDNTVIVKDAPISFVRGEVPQTFAVGKPLHLLIADSGVSASTKESVGGVRALVDSQGEIYRPLIEQVGQIVREAKAQIEKGYLLGVGHLMNLNQNVLRSLTVSSPELDRLVKAALDAGALGAKLSGGGRGGNMIALIDLPDAEKVRAALLSAGARTVWQTVVEST